MSLPTLDAGCIGCCVLTLLDVVQTITSCFALDYHSTNRMLRYVPFLHLSLTRSLFRLRLYPGRTCDPGVSTFRWPDGHGGLVRDRMKRPCTILLTFYCHPCLISLQICRQGHAVYTASHNVPSYVKNAIWVETSHTAVLSTHPVASTSAKMIHRVSRLD